MITCDHPSSQQRRLFRARDYITDDRFVVLRCGICGLAHTAPRPDGRRMARYYPPGYYGRDTRYGLVIEWLLNRLYATRARRIERACGGKPGRALDIGCGRGLLLHRLRAHGWDVGGTELSDASARYARDVLQLDILTGDVADLDLPDGAFALIIIWHVLEHVADPVGLLQEVARLLRPGGMLVVSVPNMASLEARWGKARWFHLDVPRHLHHFSPADLRALLRAEGLQPRKMSYFSIEYDYFSAVQTALNMLGIRQNLLYNLLRTRGAKVLAGQGAGPIAIAVTMALAPILGSISLVWAPVVALVRHGATVTIYATKG